MKGICWVIACALVIAVMFCGGCGGGNGCGGDQPKWPESGRYIAYVLNSSEGETFNRDIHVWDRKIGADITPADLNAPAPFKDWWPSISANGRYLAFVSERDGGSGGGDVYLYDLQAGNFVALPGLNSDKWDGSPSISGDGRYILFSSERLGGTGNADLYLYDRTTGSMVATPGLDGQWGSIGADATFIAYQSATGIHIYDLTNKQVLANDPGSFQPGDYTPAISGDGRYVVFASGRAGGVGYIDVYMYDRQTKSMVSLPGLNSTAGEETARVSWDGWWITFDTNRGGAASEFHVGIYDRNAGALVPAPWPQTDEADTEAAIN